MWTLLNEWSQKEAPLFKFQHFDSESNEKSSFIPIYVLYRIIIQQVVTKVKVSTATLSIFKKARKSPCTQREFFRHFLPFTCWSYILRLWCCVVVSLLEKIGNLLYNGTIVNFLILTPLFDIATWLFPIAIGKVLCSYHLIYLAFDDITTVIFTIISGSRTLFFQWQPGFLQWTGNFSCSEDIAFWFISAQFA